ncbi:hypothetical protein ACH5RR_041475 [Cinchona calisaya]|uniref:BHLH domain-containing protein n=1 Tax=Cinchona calisaya TaxID=153742 RepID=A0ABD2XUX8_9GENT
MFSVEYDEQLFQLLSIPLDQQQQTVPTNGLEITAMPNNADSPKPKSSKKRKPSIVFSENIQENGIPCEHRKRIIHRDVERQRRQEMASLYQSLKSLVPKEFLQGKRSISDHMHDTVNYISHLNKKVDELMSKRNELQELMKLGCNLGNLSEFSLSHNKTDITFKSSTSGMQLIVKTALNGGLPLSKFLSVLIGEGLAIISCVSTKVNGGQLHVIESEVDEGRSVDQTELQKKLRDLVYNL